MRVIVMIKATPNSEAGKLPDKSLFEAMMKYNQELIDAGVMLGGDGLQPSKEGKRLRFVGSERIVLDGPFAESKELIAGYWLWQVNSMDEAIEWIKKVPHPMPGEDTEIEIRPLYEAEHFEELFAS
jgi:hypothetical protein